jgi:predicted glutamine amidotransferase
MCRLLGFIAREVVGPGALLDDALTAFIDLSHRHNDGWGLAWYDETGRVRVEKNPEPAYASVRFARISSMVRTDALMAHLRKATPGLGVCQENTHPFSHGEIAFAHNGSIEPVDELEALIAPDIRREIQGTTDSERYFLALLTILKSSPPVEAFRIIFSIVRERLHYSSLNCLLLTPQALYAVCCYDPDDANVQKRLKGDPTYADIYYRVAADAVVVGSSGWQRGRGWEVLGNGQMLVIERGTLRTQMVDVANAAIT